MGILSEKDKIYLNKYSKYIELSENKSFAHIETYDSVDSDLYYIYESLKKDILNIRHFSSPNLRTSDPFRQISKKVLDSISFDDVEIDVEYINSAALYILLDIYKGDFVVSMDVYYIDSYYDQVEIDGDEIEDMFKVLEKNKINDTDLVGLSFDGGGDSGSLNSEFSNGKEVPPEFEEWCYSELSANFGGWELDAGSQGEFIIDFNNKTIGLNIEQNQDKTESIILFKESFID